MASIDDPSLWAKIIQHVLDEQICNYASLVGVCRLFSSLVKEYMDREIHLPHILAHPVLMPKITFQTKRQIVLQLETPLKRHQS